MSFKNNFENVTHSAQGEKGFFGGGIFCLEYPSRRSEKGNVYFANYRFSFRKLQIFISQTTDFHFVSSHVVSFHFVSQTTVTFNSKRTFIDYFSISKHLKLVSVPSAILK